MQSQLFITLHSHFSFGQMSDGSSQSALYSSSFFTVKLASSQPSSPSFTWSEAQSQITQDVDGRGLPRLRPSPPGRLM